MAEKLSEKIYNSIKQDIEQGVLDGRDFLSESQLAKDFGVSKAPVRDALHLLCGQGYLISYPRRGYMVNLFSAEEINQAQLIRRQLEKLCARLIIENASEEEILTLREFTHDDFGNLDPSKTNNALFHMRMAEICGNKYMPATLQSLVSKASQAGLRITTKTDVDKHNRIIDALLARDLAEAEAAIDDDIMFL